MMFESTLSGLGLVLEVCFLALYHCSWQSSPSSFYSFIVAVFFLFLQSFFRPLLSPPHHPRHLHHRQSASPLIVESSASSQLSSSSSSSSSSTSPPPPLLLARAIKSCFALIQVYNCIYIVYPCDLENLHELAL